MGILARLRPRHWWPRRLDQRLVLVAIVAILLLQVLFWALHSLGRMVDVSHAVARAVVEQALALDQVLDGLPEQSRAQVVAAFQTPLLHASLQPDLPPLHGPDGPAPLEAQLQGELQRALHQRHPLLAQRRAQVGVRFSHRHRAGAGFDDAPQLRLALQRTDGWLVVSASSAVFTPRRRSGPGLLSAVLFIGGLVLLGVVWATGRVARPLREFASAAERFSRDQAPARLEPRGPHEVREAIAAFNRLQERITRLLEDRTLTLAAISHDIRTALTRLRLRLEFLPADAAAPLIAEVDELTTLLDNSLALVRSEAQPEASTHLDLANLLVDLANELAAAGHPVTCNLPAHLPLDGRPLALKRVFRNLLDNAVRHGGRLDLSASILPDDQIEVRIEDRGPGIPEAQHDEVFRPFYRLEGSRSRDTGGSGLGLAIARGLVRAHGGEVTLHDRDAGGLQVRVLLPGRPQGTL